jgi:hypothetical protein
MQIPNSDDVRTSFIKNVKPFTDSQGVELWVTNIQIPINSNLQATHLPDQHTTSTSKLVRCPTSLLYQPTTATSMHVCISIPLFTPLSRICSQCTRSTTIEAHGYNKTISDKNHIDHDGVFAGVAFILAGLITLGSTCYVFKL